MLPSSAAVVRLPVSNHLRHFVSFTASCQHTLLLHLGRLSSCKHASLQLQPTNELPGHMLQQQGWHCHDQGVGITWQKCLATVFQQLGVQVLCMHSVKTDGEPDSCAMPAGATTAVMPRQATNANVHTADDIHALGSSNMSSGVQADNMSHLLLVMRMMLVLHRNQLHITGMTDSFACLGRFPPAPVQHVHVYFCFCYHTTCKSMHSLLSLNQRISADVSALVE